MAITKSSFNAVDDSAMLAGANRLYKTLRKHAPYKKIRDAVFISRVEKRGQSRFVTVSINTNKRTGVPYAPAFDKGSGLHGERRSKYQIPLKIGNPPLLKFEGTNAFQGTMVFTPVVMHPGVKGTGYVKKALDEAKPEVKKIIKKNVKEKIWTYIRAEFTDLKR